MNKNKLPDLPSELILLALKDLEVIENSDDYEVDMLNWHMFDGDKCLVCLAGAVMVNTLNHDINTDSYPDIFNKDTCDKLYALDEFRKGHINIALDSMSSATEVSYPNIAYTTNHVQYKDDSVLFKQQMNDMVKLLVSHGL